jgi:hypothetical protein
MSATTTAKTTLLEANLAGLGERNADIARRIRQIAPAPDVEFAEAADGAVTAMQQGRRLASARAPLDESKRFADGVDLVEHAVVAVLGFGLGHHVAEIARRMEKTGVVIVYEPDLALLRAVLERVDHSGWIRNAHLVLIADSDDRGGLSRKLMGGEAIVAQGVTLQRHPASRPRLGTGADEFATLVAEYVQSVKTSFLTTLVRAVDTVRNLLGNLDHYVAGPTAADLEGALAGRTAVCVAAGPSLRKNIDRLAQSGVRDRCAIIAVQTALKPLLRAGVRPHFVTALDYHEISRRFYEELTPADLEGVTLLADPKAHPAILDAFPGVVRCMSSGFLDQLLGADLKRPMGDLPAGATVAHLAVYLARFLGCRRIALIGQDLGFTDGLYYAPGTAIHEVWGPELGPFNTIANMEWQRIVRHRRHLSRISDVNGRSIHTDGQMLAYLHQFERDFSQYVEEGIEIIDATEGGASKQHTRVQPLEDVLASLESESLPELPTVERTLDEARLKAARPRLQAVRRDTRMLHRVSKQTVRTITTMLGMGGDQAKMKPLFEKIDKAKAEVEARFETFELLNYLNQLGSFRRLKADRTLHLRQRDMDAKAHQHGQLERDLVNVEWIRDAADELGRLLADAIGVLEGQPMPMRAECSRLVDEAMTESKGGEEAADIRVREPARVGAVVPIDPELSGRGTRRSVDDQMAGRSILERTVERLARANELNHIVLLAPEGWTAPDAVRSAAGRMALSVEPVEFAELRRERDGIAAARAFQPWSWRGAIAGMSAFDEALPPTLLPTVLDRHGLSAAMVVGPDWPFIDPSDAHGVNAVIRRHKQRADRLDLVFNQTCPGLGSCLLDRPLIERLAERSRRKLIGPLLVYQPDLPQADPIALDTNVQTPHRLRSASIRTTADSPRQIALLERALSSLGTDDPDGESLVAAMEQATIELACELPPMHIVIETSARTQDGNDGQPLSLSIAETIFAELSRWSAFGDIGVTFTGEDDPVSHPELGAMIEMAREAGALSVHVRTNLQSATEQSIDELIEASPDVLSVDFDRFEPMPGLPALAPAPHVDDPMVLQRLQRILNGRRHLSGPMNTGAIALPWIVPRLRRSTATFELIDAFYDRWMQALGTAVVDPLPRFTRGGETIHDELTPAVTPLAVRAHALQTRMTIRPDGSIPLAELDVPGQKTIGRLGERSIAELWRELAADRQAIIRAAYDDSKPTDDPRLELAMP